MDALCAALGLSLIGRDRRQTPEQWTASYEAMSFGREWWFRAGAALVRWTRSSMARRAVPAPRTAQA